MRWKVTTDGVEATPETCEYPDARSALDAYYARTRQLSAAGYVHDGEELVVYGRRWSRSFVRGTQRVTVRLDAPPG